MSIKYISDLCSAVCVLFALAYHSQKEKRKRRLLWLKERECVLFHFCCVVMCCVIHTNTHTHKHIITFIDWFAISCDSSFLSLSLWVLEHFLFIIQYISTHCSNKVIEFISWLCLLRMISKSIRYLVFEWIEREWVGSPLISNSRQTLIHSNSNHVFCHKKSLLSFPSKWYRFCSFFSVWFWRCVCAEGMCMCVCLFLFTDSTSSCSTNKSLQMCN
jgi:hypothetical protein